MLTQISSISPQAMIAYWGGVRESIYKLLDDTPENLLGWAPQPDMQTFGKIYVHMSTAIDYWCTQVFQDGGRWMPSDKLPKDDKAKLEKHLRESYNRISRFINTADFAKVYTVKNENLTCGYILWHMFDHDIHHRAQLMIYLRLNGIKVSD